MAYITPPVPYAQAGACLRMQNCSCLRALSTNLNSGCPYNSRHPSSQRHRMCKAAQLPRPGQQDTEPERAMSPHPEQGDTAEGLTDGCELRVLSCLRHLPSGSPGLAGDVAAHGLLLCSIWCPPLALSRTHHALCRPSAVFCCPVFRGFQRQQERKVGPCPTF